MGNKQNSINLLKPEEKSFFERFLSWTLTVGRVLVIITEAVALLAFLYRFGLDMQIVDLKDDIEPLQRYIDSKKDKEEKFRDLHDRLQLVKKYDSSASNTNNLFQKIINQARGKLVFNSIAITGEGLLIDATANSTSAMTAFVNSLKTNPDIKGISIDSVKNKPSLAQIDIIMKIAL